MLHACFEWVNMHRMDLPIACTLTGPELLKRRQTVLDLVRKTRIRTLRLADGYAYEFPPHAELAERLNDLVALERQCCPFLSFNTMETATAIRLEVTGPNEAMRVIEEFFGGLDIE
jgi:hypothetical protein